MIRIAHLSDLHFGRRFDTDTWSAVEQAVVESDPDLIIVSGDLVDHPSPVRLLAALCALRGLSQKAQEASAKLSGSRGRAAELVVVAGNHDVYRSGLSAFQGRSRWFERILNTTDTKAAEQWLEQLTGEVPGFTDTYRVGQGIVARGIAAVRHRAGRFSRHLSKSSKPHALVKRPSGTGVLLALLDSNPPRRWLNLATGLVTDAQLGALRGASDDAGCADLVRIAVVHHHVLPVAFVAGREGKSEPAMVLRNAGSVLQVLAENRYDLVLHGHWHRPQFARLNLGAVEEEEHVLAVAACGSAALKTDQPDGNSFNLITIAENGRLVVKSVFYGAGQAPNISSSDPKLVRVFAEPIATVKRRAFARARERHRIECALRTHACVITENGDLKVEHKVDGLALRKGPEPYPQRTITVSQPSQGRLITQEMRAIDHSSQARLVLKPAEPGKQGYLIDLAGGGLRVGGPPAQYTVTYDCSNSLQMTIWEAEQRSRHRGESDGSARPPSWDREWVAVQITFPMRELMMSVKMPESLATIRPRIVCRRPRNFPAYNITAAGDANVPADHLEDDTELSAEEDAQLLYAAESRTWVARIERPMVGYSYLLRWELPTSRLDAAVSGIVQDRQRTILGSRRGSVRATDELMGAAFEAFCGLSGALSKSLLCGPSRWMTAVFIYDTDALGLRPVFSSRSWSQVSLDPDFVVPLGSGVAGASFLQRRTIPWVRDLAGSSMIEPVQHPAQEGVPHVVLNNILALPVYHGSVQDMDRPPPWATIGVVVFGTDAYGSLVTSLVEETVAADTGRREVRAVAQTSMSAIVDILCNPTPHR